MSKFEDKYGFSPNPDCDVCGGDGIFVEENYDGQGAEEEPCVACMEMSNSLNNWQKTS